MKKEVKPQTFWCLRRNIAGQSGDHHDYWCLSHLYHQAINSHCIVLLDELMFIYHQEGLDVYHLS